MKTKGPSEAGAGSEVGRPKVSLGHSSPRVQPSEPLLRDVLFSRQPTCVGSVWRNFRGAGAVSVGIRRHFARFSLCLCGLLFALFAVILHLILQFLGCFGCMMMYY